MAKKKWIKDATKNKGGLTRAAKASGKSISEFCAQGDKLSTKNKRRCALAKTLKKVRPKKGKK